MRTGDATTRWALGVLVLVAGCGDPTSAARADGGRRADGAPGLADGGARDVTTTCFGLGQIACGEDCVFPTTDEANCGGCGVRCPADAFCYASACHVQSGSYVGAAVAPRFVDACAQPGSTRVLAGQDDGAVEVEMPVGFAFFGYRYPGGSMVGVSSNGFVEFDGAVGVRGGSAISGVIPDTAAPDGVVAPFWSDLITDRGVCLASVVTATGRSWIVQWADARYYGVPNDNPGRLSFEVIFSETGGTIEFQYQGLPAYEPGWAPRSATVGVENLTGTRGVASCNGVPVGDCRPLATRYSPVP